MTTRLYFSTPDSGLPVTPSSWSSGWNKTTGTSSRLLLLRPSDAIGAIADVANAASGTSGHFTAIRRYVSPPLGVDQTIAGTIKGQMRCFESAAGDNYTLAVAAKVIQPDGSDRGVLVAVSASDDTSATPPEMAVTTLTNRAFRDSAESASITLSSIDATAGDRIVIEVGFRQASASVANGTINQGADLIDDDLPENDTATAIDNAWIEFSQNLAFLGYFNSNSIPNDNGLSAVDPLVIPGPSGMLAGDLVCMIGHQRATGVTLAISDAGGQSWTTETAIGVTSCTARLFWCIFDGTWDSNPSVDFTNTVCNSVTMHVFRPPATDWTWEVNQALVELDDATDPHTIIGQTTTGTNPTVTFAGWFTADDNTWGTLTGTGWQTIGQQQYRNTSGNDVSSTFAHKIQFAAAATGNTAKTQLTQGLDATTTFIITFAAVPPAAAINELGIYFNGKLQPTTLRSYPVLRHNIAADFSTAQTQAETNTHFVGKFRPDRLKLLTALRQNEPQDFSRAEAETNTYFLAKFQPYRITLQAGLRQTPAQDASTVFAQAETNTHFLSRFQPTKIIALRSLRQDVSESIVVQRFGGPFTRLGAEGYGVQRTGPFTGRAPTQAETAVNFVGRFSQYRIRLTAALRQNEAQDTSTAQPETNTNFLARFRPYSITLQRQLRETLAQDASTVFTQAETNVHFIGHFQPVRFQLLPLLRHNIAADFSSFVQPETDTYFLARFRSYKINLALALRQTTANDTSAPQTQAATNVHFVGRFREPQIKKLAALWQNADSIVVPKAETNTYFIGKFKPSRFTLLSGLRQNAATDLGVAQPSTPAYFIGRFAPLHLRKLAALRQNAANDVNAFLQTLTPGHFVNASVFYQPTIQSSDIFYDFPVGRGLKSDYGRRQSQLGRDKYIIGRR